MRAEDIHQLEVSDIIRTSWSDRIINVEVVSLTFTAGSENTLYTCAKFIPTLFIPKCNSGILLKAAVVEPWPAL